MTLFDINKKALGSFVWIMILSFNICYIAFFFLYFQAVLGEVKTYNYAKKSMYSNVIPSSDLAVVDGKLSRIECTLLCGYEMACQTFFYKPNDRSCSIYKYPLLNNTPVNLESGVEVFEIKGKLNTFGTL